MDISSFAHLFIGCLICIKLFANRVHSAVILLFISSLALLKEVIDHSFYQNHDYGFCMKEHYQDFFFSIVFFFIYVPFLNNQRIKEHRFRYQIKAFLFLIAFLSLQSVYQYIR